MALMYSANSRSTGLWSFECPSPQERRNHVAGASVVVVLWVLRFIVPLTEIRDCKRFLFWPNRGRKLLVWLLSAAQQHELDSSPQFDASLRWQSCAKHLQFTNSSHTSCFFKHVQRDSRNITVSTQWFTRKRLASHLDRTSPEAAQWDNETLGDTVEC